MQEVSRGRHRKPIFPESEPRFVYAKDNRLGPDASLVFLPEGGAETLRADCRDGHLWCPFPGCDLRFVTTRGGQRRHHFMHEREAVHSPETYFHMLGKHLLRQWARKRYPSAQVQMEERLENGRIPDVLVTLDGYRFAFEIQYSALAPETAQQRHEDYRALGIIDIWLLGHRPPHLVSAPPHSEELHLVQMGQTQRRLVELGAQCFWIAPEGMEDGAIVTAWTASHRQVDPSTLAPSDKPHRLPMAPAAWDDWSWRHPPSKSDDVMHFEVDPLSECDLEEQRFVTPELRRLWEARARIDTLTAQRIDSLQREADAQRAAQLALNTRASPDTLKDSPSQPGGGPAEALRETPGQQPGMSRVLRLHATLAALQKHPWFIVRTRTRCYVTGAETITFEVRDRVQIGSIEGTRRAIISLEEGTAWA